MAPCSPAPQLAATVARVAAAAVRAPQQPACDAPASAPVPVQALREGPLRARLRGERWRRRRRARAEQVRMRFCPPPTPPRGHHACVRACMLHAPTRAPSAGCPRLPLARLLATAGAAAAGTGPPERAWKAPATKRWAPLAGWAAVALGGAAAAVGLLLWAARGRGLGCWAAADGLWRWGRAGLLRADVLHEPGRWAAAGLLGAARVG